MSDHSDAPHVIAQLDLRDRLIKMIGYGRQVNPRRVVVYPSLESCAVQMLNQIGEVGRRASDAMYEKDGNSDDRRSFELVNDPEPSNEMCASC